MLSLTQRHIGVADVFVVSQVGTARDCQADSQAPANVTLLLQKGRPSCKAVQYPNCNMGHSGLLMTPAAGWRWALMQTLAQRSSCTMAQLLPYL